MVDIQSVYSILLARGYQDQLFSKLPGERKKESGGKETLVTCPFCQKEDHFSYNSQKPVWQCWSCGESGDWLKFLEKNSGYSFQEALVYLAQEAGVEVSAHTQETYQRYTKRADILETAQKYFEDTLDNFSEDPLSREIDDYLLARGYKEEDILAMELGAYTDRQSLQQKLSEAGYTDQEIKDSGLMTKDFGEVYKMTLLWRDQAGRAIGLVGRSILSGDELKSRGLPKYKYSAGLQKDKGLIGFSASRGAEQVVMVEGVLDALYLNTKGFQSIAVGGTSLSVDQIQALEVSGTKEVLLAFDMDEPGQKATERTLSRLSTSGLRAYVVSWPTDYKDPDELVRKQGAEAFQTAVDQAERASSWKAKRIASKHDLSTDRGLDQALEEAQDIYAGLADKLEARSFLESLSQSTGLEKEELSQKLEEAWQKASVQITQKKLEQNVQNIAQKASGGDITGAEAGLIQALAEVRSSRGVEAPQPYLLEDLITDVYSTTPAMSTGYNKLDRLAKIPAGALTIIAGRPGHGKTTLQLNLLVNMLKGYPDKSFCLFSYEEAKKALAIKLIMILSGEILSQESNYNAFLNYFQQKRGSNAKIEQAVSEYEELTSSGRLLLSDQMYPAEDLVSVISQLSKRERIGAVIVDYIQKIPLSSPSQGQRYLDLKHISGLLLQQAVSTDLPIILGAQLGRGQGFGSKIRLDNLRESGDIEQDANLVIGLYTGAVEKAEEEDYQTPVRLDPEVEISLSILKNRTGQAGRSIKMTLESPTLKIKE
jgi:DNA primase catalytic core